MDAEDILKESFMYTRPDGLEVCRGYVGVGNMSRRRGVHCLHEHVWGTAGRGRDWRGTEVGEERE